MSAGRGRSTSPRASEEERWLQMAESALFWLRAVAGRLPENHDLYSDDKWSSAAREAVPETRQVLRIADELASLARLPYGSAGRLALADARSSFSADPLPKRRLRQLKLLEILIESVYERREAEL